MFGWQSLPVLGIARLLFSHPDLNSLVVILCMPVEVLVLPELSVFDGDVLIGRDFVSVCGSLLLDYDNSDEILARVVLGGLHLRTSPPVLSNVRQQRTLCGMWMTRCHGMSLFIITETMWCCRLMMVR